MAVHTVIRFLDGGWVVALFVEPGGKFQHPFGTELKTVSATFTPVFYDVDNAPGNLDLFRVQRNAPKCHRLFLKRS